MECGSCGNQYSRSRLPLQLICCGLQLCRFCYSVNYFKNKRCKNESCQNPKIEKFEVDNANNSDSYFVLYNLLDNGDDAQTDTMATQHVDAYGAQNLPQDNTEEVIIISDDSSQDESESSESDSSDSESDSSEDESESCPEISCESNQDADPEQTLVENRRDKINNELNKQGANCDSNGHFDVDDEDITIDNVGELADTQFEGTKHSNDAEEKVLYSNRAPDELDLTCHFKDCMNIAPNVTYFKNHILNHYKDRFRPYLPCQSPYICPQKGCLRTKPFDNIHNLMSHFVWRHDQFFRVIKELNPLDFIALLRQRRKAGPNCFLQYNKRTSLPSFSLKHTEYEGRSSMKRRSTRRCWLMKSVRQLMTREEKRRFIEDKRKMSPKYHRLAMKLKSLRSRKSVKQTISESLVDRSWHWQNYFDGDEKKKFESFKQRKIYKKFYLPLASGIDYVTEASSSSNYKSSNNKRNQSNNYKSLFLYENLRQFSDQDDSDEENIGTPGQSVNGINADSERGKSLTEEPNLEDDLANVDDHFGESDSDMEVDESNHSHFDVERPGKSYVETLHGVSSKKIVISSAEEDEGSTAELNEKSSDQIHSSEEYLECREMAEKFICKNSTESQMNLLKEDLKKVFEVNSQDDASDYGSDDEFTMTRSPRGRHASCHSLAFSECTESELEEDAFNKEERKADSDYHDIDKNEQVQNKETEDSETSTITEQYHNMEKVSNTAESQFLVSFVAHKVGNNASTPDFYISFVTYAVHKSHNENDDLDKEACHSMSPNQEGIQEAAPNGNLVKVNENDIERIMNSNVPTKRESSSPVQLDPESFKIKKRRQSGEYYEDKHEFMKYDMELTSNRIHEVCNFPQMILVKIAKSTLWPCLDFNFVMPCLVLFQLWVSLICL